MQLPYIDMWIVLPQEYMHSQMLGTVKLMLDNWLGKRTDKSRALKDSSIALLNSRLAKLKFPSNLLRRVPEVNDPKKFKAVDFENMLFYGVVCFEGVLPSDEFENFKLLSLIISTLTSRSISLQQISQCDEWIATFIESYRKTYTTEMFKSNIHILFHLPGIARRFGPLITNSAYIVENTMGELVRKVKTATKVSEQVLKKSLIASQLLLSISQNYAKHSDSFKKHIIEEKYFPALFSEETDPIEQIRILKGDYTLTEIERDLLSSTFDLSLPPDEIVEKVSKIFIDNFYVSPNDFNNANCSHNNNQFIKDKAGNYFVVNNIVKINNIIYLFCFQYVNLQNYIVLNEFAFQHIHYTLYPPQNQQILLLSDIDRPFSMLFLTHLDSHKFILFDLFNSHL